MQRLLPLLLLVALAHPAGAALSEKPDAAGLDFFEKKIRPVLVEKCYKCHSSDAEKIKGGLVLDSREAIRRGGDSGPAVMPGKPGDSLLIEAIRYANKDSAMPPTKAGGKLPDAVIQDFEKWVEMGAPDPREGAPRVAAQPEAWEKARSWWAWQAPQAAPVPTVQDATWPRTSLDHFLLSALEAKGLHPVGEADRLTLLRRVYFDLVGLPPSPDEIAAFLKDTTPQALARVVDRLLAAPQFGERWGRHWLDVARYAESSGKDANFAFPHAWRYRDYVIASFNVDKPFDQFIREQLAGDLLAAGTDAQRAERTVATGFLALGPKSLNEMNPRQYALDLADEQLDATCQAFLGLTAGCARCHDHKFDPIPQKEYYSLAGIFLSTETHYGTAFAVQNRHATDLLELPADAHAATLGKVLSASERTLKEKRLEELKLEQRELIKERFQSGPGGGLPAQKQIRGLVLVTQIGFLDAELKNYQADGTMKTLAMGVRDLPASFPLRMGAGFFGRGGSAEDRYAARLREFTARPREFNHIADSAVYARGDADKPGEKAPRGFFSLLTLSTPPIIPAGSSGRLELAEWISSPQNPLTARVAVNRVWHWIFGQGLVSSTDNFGTTGALPSNQALLDHLALEFVQHGWSVKWLVREIVLSHAYGLASTYQEAAFAADPENTLLWRMSKRRLEAECIRDAVLAASGQLQLQPPTGSIIARAGDGPIGARRYVGISEEAIVNAGARQATRSVYLPIARDLLPDALAVFDFAEPSLVSGTRESTNVPAQALYLLNSPFIEEAAGHLAGRLLKEHPASLGSLTANLEPRVTQAYWLVFSRAPSPAEKQAAQTFFTRFPDHWKRGDEHTEATHDAAGVNAAWTSFCRALFASSEFRYLN